MSAEEVAQLLKKRNLLVDGDFQHEGEMLR